MAVLGNVPIETLKAISVEYGQGETDRVRLSSKYNLPLDKIDRIITIHRDKKKIADLRKERGKNENNYNLFHRLGLSKEDSFRIIAGMANSRDVIEKKYGIDKYLKLAEIEKTDTTIEHLHLHKDNVLQLSNSDLVNKLTNKLKE